MKNTIFIIALLLCVGCNSESNNPPSLPGDSAVEIQKVYDQILTKCGNKSWLQSLSGWTEFNNFEWSFQNMPLTDTDHNLNKIEWRVRTTVKPGVPYRVWNPLYRSWETEWRESNPFYSDLAIDKTSFVIQKQNGEVLFNGYKLMQYNSRHFTCTNMPKD